MLNNSYGRPCPECGRPLLPGQALHLDHRIPTSAGGIDHPSNLQVTHARCNMRKGNKVSREIWAEWR